MKARLIELIIFKKNLCLQCVGGLRGVMGAAGKRVFITHAFDGWRGMDDKPTLKELVTHVNVGVEWMRLGVHLDLDMKDLEAIDLVKPAIPDKLQQMYNRWLNVKTGATRRQLLDALRVLKLNVLAGEYKEWIRVTFSKRPITRHMASSKVKSKPGR